MATALDGLGRQIANIEPASASAAVGDVRQELSPKLAKLVIGQQLRGEIISKLTDGSFTVKVAGFTAKMILPKEFVQGDSVPLRLISVQPRPTFLLDHQSEEAPVTNAETNGSRSEDSSELTPNTVSAKSARPGTVINERSAPAQNLLEQDVVVHLSEGNNKASAGAAQQNQVADPPLTPNSHLTRTYTETAQVATPAKLADVKTNPASQTSELATNDKSSSAPTSFSQTAKVINQVLKSYAQGPEAAVIKSSHPVLEQAPQLTHTTELASRLQQQIERSGLFFESHLAQWAEGKLSLQELKQEPQIQLQNLTEAAASSASGSNTTDQLNQLLNSQLQVLDQPKVIWHGELIPGQKMEWQIQKEQARQTHTQAEEQQVWYSSVRFELPHLGPIEARLQLNGNQLGLNLISSDPETLELLKEKLTLLSDNLQSSGTDLTSFNAKINE